MLNDNDTNLLTVHVDELLDNMHIMDTDEEVGVKSEMDNPTHTLKIKYTVEGPEYDLRCAPVAIEPTYANLNDYIINFNPSQRCIGQISNIQYGSVKFDGEEIDPNESVTSNTPIDIWTTLTQNKQIRVLFCNLHDRNDSETYSFHHMAPNTEISEYSKFDQSDSGGPLKYKILLQNCKVRAILYNINGSKIQEVPFTETQITAYTMMQAIIPEVYEQPIIVKLLPTTALHFTKEGLGGDQLGEPEHYSLTTSKMRCFKGLRGLVDVQLISADNCDSLYQGEHFFSIPV